MSGRRDSMNTMVLNTTMSSNNGIDSLTFERSSLSTKRAKFDVYFKKLMEFSRDVLAKDHTYDRSGLHFLKIERYFCLRDKVCAWVTHHDNAALFIDCDTFFELAMMETAMHTLEIVLGLPHHLIRWPGAHCAPNPTWPGVQRGEVYRRLDELIYADPGLHVGIMF